MDREAVIERTELFEKVEEFAGIDMRLKQQLALLKELRLHYPAINFSKEQRDGERYYYDNAYFSYSDAIFYSLLIRYFKPKRIIEVGSGFSSACALDTLEAMSHKAELAFIDPSLDRLNSLLKAKDKESYRIEIINTVVQEIPSVFFKSLKQNDILFIDSSHVSKTGSDLNYLLHEILPSLNEGVMVHFHDVFHNFEYPQAWIEEGISLNEQYMLRSFLQFNDSFGILLFNNYLEVHYREWFEQHMPRCLELHERYSMGPRKGELNGDVMGQGLWLLRL